MVLVRLQKILADAGVASRRGGEELIRAGKISVNGRVISQLGFKADPDRDRIKVNGQLIPRPSPKVYYLFYKPAGVITSLHDPEGRPTIKDLIPRIKAKDRWFGRHVQEWITASKGGTAACSSFEIAGPLSEIVLLGNVALLLGEPIEWDRRTMKIAGQPVESRYLRPQYRSGWSL